MARPSYLPKALSPNLRVLGYVFLSNFCETASGYVQAEDCVCLSQTKWFNGWPCFCRHCSHLFSWDSKEMCSCLVALHTQGIVRAYHRYTWGGFGNGCSKKNSPQSLTSSTNGSPSSVFFLALCSQANWITAGCGEPRQGSLERTCHTVEEAWFVEWLWKMPVGFRQAG